MWTAAVRADATFFSKIKPRAPVSVAAATAFTLHPIVFSLTCEFRFKNTKKKIPPQFHDPPEDDVT